MNKMWFIKSVVTFRRIPANSAPFQTITWFCFTCISLIIPVYKNACSSDLSLEFLRSKKMMILLKSTYFLSGALVRGAGTFLCVNYVWVEARHIDLELDFMISVGHIPPAKSSRTTNTQEKDFIDRDVVQTSNLSLSNKHTHTHTKKKYMQPPPQKKLPY